MKVEKSYVTPKWLTIKEMYENGTNGSDKYGTNFPIGGELDKLTSVFVHELGEMTQRNGYGYVIDDVKLDLWKERIWCLIENAGLLREIAWKEEKEKLKSQSRSYYRDIEDFGSLEEEPTDKDLNNLESINILNSLQDE